MNEATTDPSVKIIKNAARDDIRPGDHVTWEQTKQRGRLTRTARHEGIAHRRDASGNWCTEDSQWITIGEDEHATITIRRVVRDLPAKPETIIVPADGHKYITATVGGETYRAREAILSWGGNWHAAWRSGDHTRIGVPPGDITPGTWQVAGQ